MLEPILKVSFVNPSWFSKSALPMKLSSFAEWALIAVCIKSLSPLKSAVGLKSFDVLPREVVSERSFLSLTMEEIATKGSVILELF